MICTGIIAALFLLTGRVSGKKGQSNQLFHSGFLLLILPRVLGIDYRNYKEGMYSMNEKSRKSKQ